MEAEDLGDRVEDLKLARERIEGERASRESLDKLPEQLSRPDTIRRAQEEPKRIDVRGSEASIAA